MFYTSHFIDGRFQDSLSGDTFISYNPANNEPITHIANGKKEDVDLAVRAAKNSLYSTNWGYNSTGSQRSSILLKLKDIIDQHKEQIVYLDSLEMGKAKREVEADIGDALTACEYYAQLALNQDDSQDELVENGTDGDFVTRIRYEPIGVVAAITPWNYPFLMAIWKVVPAIAAGCAIVLKPSEWASQSCLLLGELCYKAGLPSGALNVVAGLGKDAGAALTDHADIDKVSFTGSVPTARKIMAACALGPRGISLELGGKSPLIVFEDILTDPSTAERYLDSCIDWIITGFCWGSGQVCSATSRLLVHQSIKPRLVEKLLAKVKAIPIGDSLSEAVKQLGSPSMGPLVSIEQFQKVKNYLDIAAQEGLQFLCGDASEQRELLINGRLLGDSGEALSNGYFVAPTILDEVPKESRLWKEEIFGPVLCIKSFESEQEAVDLANESEYGLASAIFSADPGRCDRVRKDLRSGIVWINCGQPAFIQAPWGGVKRSGFGRELGRWGIEEFTAVKQVTSCELGYSWSLWA